MDLDLIIRGGTIFDGLGGDGFVGDVCIRGGRIASISRRLRPDGPPPPPAARVIDAAGKFVLPGFIDIHSHSDFAWLIWPNATSKLLAGVTTEVGGNCGYGAFPLAGEVLARRQSEYAPDGLTIDWSDAAGYFRRLEATPCSINRAVLIGHGNVRGVTVGFGPGRATAEQRAAMGKLVADGMSAGAFGLSSGLIYAPGCWADADELADLARVVRDHGGFYASHVRSECDGLLAAADEFIDVVRRSGCRGQFSHIKTGSRSVWPRLGELHEKLSHARSDGLAIFADRYPYVAGNTGLVSMLLRRWAVEGTRHDVLERLAAPTTRKRIADEVREYGEEFFDDVRVVSFARAELQRFAGLSLRQIGRLRNADPAESAIDLLIEDELAPDAIHFSMSDSNLERILAWDFVMIGSDSSVRDALADGPMCHPRAFGAPGRFLGEFVRERNVCDWSTAARKLAAMPAGQLGLTDRGRLKPGYWADVTVVDPHRVADQATYERPRAAPSGIEYVVVNGKIAVDRAQYTGSTTGAVLRRA